MNQDSRIIDRAIRRYIEGDTSAIDNLYISILEGNDGRVLSDIIDTWPDKNPIFKEWIRIILAARKSHNEGQYVLSIPALLLVIEGISRNLGICFETYVHRKMRSQAHRSLKTLMESAENRIPDLSLSVDYFLEALHSYLYKDTNKGDEIDERQPTVLNRHSILHGYSTEYGTVANSLRCFMVLDVLSLIKLDSENDPSTNTDHS
jgi:hypothetical protein